MDKIDELLIRGVEKIYPSKEALEKTLRQGKKLRLYQGFDPSAPSLHLGNYVGVLKLSQFQQLGHEVIFLVGDFTGMIGDPTDKLSARKLLTREQTLENSAVWKKQIGKILDFEGSNPIKFLYNSSWNDQISFKDLIEICAKFTVQQMLERDMFQERLKKKQPIYLHEFLYPIAQAIDSVKMDVDLELGGNDQTFNMLAGRTLMAALEGKEKFVMTTKLLVDARGEKIGKTTGNALFLNQPAESFYGGIMAFPDDILALSFELLTRLPYKEIKAFDLKKEPMVFKKRLAFEVVKIIYGQKSASQAQDQFEQTFQQGKNPEVETKEIKSQGKNLSLDQLLVKCGSLPTINMAKNLIKQGGVDVNGETITDRNFCPPVNQVLNIKAGKKIFLKIKINPCEDK